MKQNINTNININCFLNLKIAHKVENVILFQGKQKSMPTYLVKIAPNTMKEVITI
jgi:hypothetical protein